MYPRTPSTRNGFTMIELVLVMVIIGALAIFAAPAFFDTARFSEYAFHRELLSAVRFAQKTALASGCEVEFSAQSSGYVLSYRAGGTETSCGTGAFSAALTGADGRAYAGTTPSGVTLGNLTLYFDAQGRPHASDGTLSGATLSLGTRSIVIENGTGYAH